MVLMNQSHIQNRQRPFSALPGRWQGLSKALQKWLPVFRFGNATRDEPALPAKSPHPIPSPQAGEGEEREDLPEMGREKKERASPEMGEGEERESLPRNGRGRRKRESLPRNREGAIRHRQNM